jgi:predicted nucleic acid-binding protein
MTEYLFPDTTVLCNFASVDRLDLLRSVLNGRGRWTAAVAYEVTRSSRVLPPLADVASDGWLGEPVEVDAEPDIVRVNQLRRAVFGGTDDQPLQHLGEAETCFVIRDWAAFAGSWWISDDRESLRFARFQGITTRETVDVVSIAVVNGDVTAEEGFELLKGMADHGRSLRLPRTAADLHR